MFTKRRHVLMDEAGAEGAAGGAAPAGAAAAPASGGAPASGVPAAAAASPAAPSVLASGAAAPGAAEGGAPTPGPNDWLSEKHRVTKQDGTLDIEASARKVAASQRELESRMGAGGLPPNSADDYKLTVPEAWAAEITPEALAADPEFKGFLGRLHAVKLNQAQLDVVMSELIDRSMKLQDDIPQASADETTAALKADWKTDDEFQRNVSAAYKAGAAFGDIDALMAKYGNDPDFIRFAAKVGAELSEDTGTPGGSQQLAEPDVEALMKSPAYWNASDPQHANVKAKVAAHYAAVHGNKPRTTGSMAFSSAVG